MTLATARGACPDSLAVEVYKRTLDLVSRRFRTSPLVAQAAPDAVGEAYTSWLAGSADKTPHAAAEHATFLAKKATTLLIGADPSLAKRMRQIRSIAETGLYTNDEDGGEERTSAVNEARYRQHYGLPEPAACETHVLDDLDFMATRGRGYKCTWKQALHGLLDRGWSRTQVAMRLGISYPTLHKWLTTDMTPAASRRAEIVALFARDEAPPAHITSREVALRRAAAVAAGVVLAPPPPADDSWKLDVAALLSRGWNVYRLSKRLGINQSTIRNWVLHECAPNDENRSTLVTLAASEEGPCNERLDALIEIFLTGTAAGPVNAHHPGLSRHILERLVAVGVAQRVEVEVPPGPRKKRRPTPQQPRRGVMYARATPAP